MQEIIKILYASSRRDTGNSQEQKILRNILGRFLSVIFRVSYFEIQSEQHRDDSNANLQSLFQQLVTLETIIFHDHVENILKICPIVGPNIFKTVKNVVLTLFYLVKLQAAKNKSGAQLDTANLIMCSNELYKNYSKMVKKYLVLSANQNYSFRQKYRKILCIDVPDENESDC